MVPIMRQTIKFLIGLVLSLALLTWATSTIVQRTTRRWFENDVRLRAELVVSGAREALIAHWSRDDRRELERMLNEITRDERIMAVAACNPDLTLLTSTSGFPSIFSCNVIGTHVRPSEDAPAESWAHLAPINVFTGRLGARQRNSNRKRRPSARICYPGP